MIDLCRLKYRGTDDTYYSDCQFVRYLLHPQIDGINGRFKDNLQGIAHPKKKQILWI